MPVAPDEPAWLHPHVHEPNPEPPTADPAILVRLPDGRQATVDVAALRSLPAVRIPDCLIVSTGHGTSGPFEFAGARLDDLLRSVLGPGQPWHHADVVSADGFGTRVYADELAPSAARPPLLSYAVDDRPLTRAQGLVRLVVPSETDDALRQVKWVAEIRVATGQAGQPDADDGGA